MLAKLCSDFIPSFTRSLPATAILGFVVMMIPTSSVADDGNASPRPNVVLILVDDLGLHDLTVEGSRFYRTPHIDALAGSGMRFTAGYANCRVCSPSRASILLGQFPPRHGITQWIGGATGMKFNRNEPLLQPDYARQLPAADTTLAESLSEAGYRTFFAGKWHLGGTNSLPTDHGFQINYGGHDKGSPPGGYFSPYNNPLLEDGPAGESLTLRLADETAKFVSQKASTPYFAMLAFYTVHGPVQTTQPLWKKYRDAAPAPPADGNRFRVDRTLPVRQVQDHPIYAGMIELLDDAVGRVLDAIDDAGDRDNTIVIFTSDNGGVSSGDAYSTSNLPLRGGKGRQWEGGIREPYYIRYPKLTRAGMKCDVPVTGADLYPTILDLAGLPLKPRQHADGKSLRKLLAGESDAVLSERSLIWHYPHYDNQGGEPSSLIREGDYKLIHYHLDGHDELYQLKDDPSEQNDLAAQQPERVAQMRKTLLTYLNSVEAQFPTPDPRYDAEKAKATQARVEGIGKENLERAHAQMLEPNYQPNPTWWGSSVD
jgi:arylsulfatase A-like enzyme